MRTLVAGRRIPLVVLLVALPMASPAATVPPTAFEAFATHPDTVVVSSREIGSLTSVDSTATVTVLVAASRADATQRMRGARVELTNNVGTERIYLDERQLAKLEMDVGLMELGLAAPFRAPESGRGNMVMGTDGCWMPNPVQRILCPEMQWAPTWTGLRLWTFGGPTFDFRDRTVADLRALVEQAVTDLNGL